jgi:hypothetical protein
MDPADIFHVRPESRGIDPAPPACRCLVSRSEVNRHVETGQSICGGFDLATKQDFGLGAERRQKRDRPGTGSVRGGVEIEPKIVPRPLSRSAGDSVPSAVRMLSFCQRLYLAIISANSLFGMPMLRASERTAGDASIGINTMVRSSMTATKQNRPPG